MPPNRSPKKASPAKARSPSSQTVEARVMEKLSDKEPQSTKDLSIKLDLYQSSVSHALRKLMEEGLVMKQSRGYCLSGIGVIERNTREWMEKTMRSLRDNRDFIQSHDLSVIPKGFQVTMGVIFEERESIENDSSFPTRIHEIVVPILAQAKCILVASSALVPEHQASAAQALREGGRLTTVTTKRIIEELRLKSYALRDKSLHGKIALYSRSEINLHLMVTETHLFLALPRLDGSYDFENIIMSKSPAALDWGRMLFYYFLTGSEKVDLATF